MIIGIAGAIGAGKDTLAARLIDAHGFIRVNFADALKDEVLVRMPRTVAAILALHFPWDANGEKVIPKVAMRDAVFNAKPPGIRELLQEYGTEVRRADDPDYWINAWAGRLPEGFTMGARIVTTDVRFPNEVKAVKDLGGVVVCVKRPGTRPTLGAHPSETSLLTHDFDHIFYNDGTVAALWNQLDSWLAAGAWT